MKKGRQGLKSKKQGLLSQGENDFNFKLRRTSPHSSVCEDKKCWKLNWGLKPSSSINMDVKLRLAEKWGWGRRRNNLVWVISYWNKWKIGINEIY